MKTIEYFTLEELNYIRAHLKWAFHIEPTDATRLIDIKLLTMITEALLQKSDKDDILNNMEDL